MIMEDEYYWDIYEIFKEQLDLQLPQIESHILTLSKEELVPLPQTNIKN